MNLLFIILISILIVVRVLRWLAIVQQKEYRWDRLVLFARSREGLGELLKIRFGFGDFTRSGLKRPVRTVRIGIVSMTAILVLLPLLGLSLYLRGSEGLMVAVLTFLFVPVFVLVSVLPSTVISEVYKRRVIARAKAMIREASPIVIGLTGSYGKTSTKKIAAAVLRSKFSVFATPASYNTLYSVSKSIVDHYRGEKLCLLEFGAYRPGEIARLCTAFNPQHAVITGVSDQHVGLFGSVENLMKAKHELVEGIPADGVVFANSQDERVHQMLSHDTKKIVWYSTEEQLTRARVSVTREGLLQMKLGKEMVTIPLVGRHYAINVLGATALARFLEVPLSTIRACLVALKNEQTFVSTYRLVNGGLLIDDGRSANRKGVEAAFQLVKDLKPKKAILAFAGIVDLGDLSESIHLKLAKESKQIFDGVWYLGTVGLQEFREVWGKQLRQDEIALPAQVKKLEAGEVLLVEGRLPKKLENQLKRLRADHE